MILTPATNMECEIKFDVSEECLKRIKSKKICKSGNSGKAHTKNLRTIYFDSPDFDLRHADMSLRLRRINKSWIQTLKSGNSVIGGLSNPIEIETEVSDETPDLNAISDPKLKIQIKKILENKPLSAIFETRIRRTTRNFVSSKGDEIEIAFDSGFINTPNGSKPLTELELELKKGNPAALLEVAKELLKNESWRYSTQKKSSRGYSLLIGQPDSTVVRAASNKSNLTKNDKIELAIYKIFRSCYDQITQNSQFIIESDEPEGPHQFRVGIRRFRSAFKCFSQVLHKDALQAVNEELKNIALEVGRLRDLDVFINEIVLESRDSAPNYINFESLLIAAKERRTAVKSEVVKLLDSPKFRDFLLTFGMAIESRDWIGAEFSMRNGARESNLMEFSRKILEKNWKNIKKKTKRLDSLSIEQRHELRKKIKAFRYTVDCFLPLYDSSETGKFLKSMKKLQNKFGYMNDIAMTESICSDMKMQNSHDLSSDLAMGYVLGWHTAKSDSHWNEIIEFWEKISTIEPFWT